MAKQLATQTDTTLGYESPLFRAATVTLSDSQDFTDFPVRGFMIANDGSVSIQLVNNLGSGNETEGDIITLQNLKAGVIYPFLVKRFRSTETTSPVVVALG